MKTIKKITWEISKYFIVSGFFLVPLFLVLIGFDFMADLELNFFQAYSFPRVLFYIAFLIVTGAYVWTEWGEYLKKII